MQNQDLSLPFINQTHYLNEEEFPKDEENNKESLYDPYQCPPSIEMAKNHAKAKTVGLIKQSLQSDICICCRFTIHKEKLRLFCDEKELSFLGSGFPLYFRLTKYFALLLFIILLTSSLPILYINYVYQDEDSIYLKYIGIIFNKNTPSNKFTDLDYVSMVTCLFIMAFVAYLRPKLQEDVYSYNEHFNNPSNYTLIIQNIPLDQKKTEIEQFLKIKLFGDSKTDEICQLNICYDYQEYLNHFNDKLKNIFQINLAKTALKNNYLEEPYATETKDKFQELTQQQQIYDKKLRNFEKECDSEVSSKFSGTVLVSFLNQKQKQKTLYKYKFSFWRVVMNIFKKQFLRYRGNILIIRQAPGPRDIIWANLNFTFQQYIHKLIKTFILFISLLIVSYYIQSLVIQKSIAYHQIYQSEKQEDIKIQKIRQLSIIIAVLISFIDFILKYIVKYFCSTIKPVSMSMFNQNYILIYTVVSFFNSGVLPHLVLGKSSLVVDTQILFTLEIHFILFIQALIIPLFKVLDYRQFYRLYKRYDIKSYQPQDCPYSQHETNSWFEGNKMDFAECSCSILRMLLIAIWYASIAPTGILPILLSYFICYWLDKILLLRFYQFPTSQRDLVFSFALKVLLFLPLIYFLGAIQYQTTVSKSQSIIEFLIQYPSYQYALITISTLTILLAFYIRKQNTKKYKEQKQHMNQQDYYQASLYFRQEYHHANPINMYSNHKIQQENQYQFYGEQNYKRKNTDLLKKKSLLASYYQHSMIKNQLYKSSNAFNSIYGKSQKFTKKGNTKIHKPIRITSYNELLDFKKHKYTSQNDQY